MSGFEIAGIILGAIPLALEMYDRSGGLLERLSAFSEHAIEIQRFETQMQCLRRTFRSSCLLLEHTLVDCEHTVRRIVNQQPEPDSKTLEGSLKGLLRSCGQFAEHVHSQLRPLCGVWDDLHRRIEEAQTRTGSDLWAEFRDRCETALSVEIRKSCLTQLRTFNGDFRDARENVTAILQRLTHPNNGLVTLHRGPTDNARTLRKYQQARLASSALYSTLSGWRCRPTHSHLFQARILNHSSEGPVSFELLTEKKANPTLNPREPLLVQVEQACGTRTTDTDTLPLVIQQLKEHKTDQPVATDTQLPYKRSRRLKVHITKMSSRLKSFVNSQSRTQIQRPANQDLGPGTSPPTTGSQEAKAQGPAPDTVRLSGFEDFCVKIKETATDFPARSYLGSWTEPAEMQAQWYTVPFTGSLRSLQDLLSWMEEGSAANNALCELTPECKIGLAHDVAKGIMQFYKTPWLASRQLSTNICGTSLEPSTTTTAWVGHLYFVCQMDPQINPRGALPPANPENGNFLLDNAENELLFNLGILLLEFGFGKPWVNLKREFLQLEAPDHTGTIPDARIAVALAQTVSLRIGPRYMQIVKKCLRCDFGTGDTDLDREELQRCFLNDVVGGLQKLHADMVRAFSTP